MSIRTQGEVIFENWWLVRTTWATLNMHSGRHMKQLEGGHNSKKIVLPNCDKNLPNK
jgi:hypothetical protein